MPHACPLSNAFKIACVTSHYRQLFTVSFAAVLSQVYKQSEYETCDLRIALLKMAYDHAIFIWALNFHVMQANTKLRQN